MELKEYRKSTQRILKKSFTNVMEQSELKEENSPKKIFVSSFLGSLNRFQINDPIGETVMSNWGVKWIEESGGEMIEIGKRLSVIFVFLDRCIKDMLHHYVLGSCMHKLLECVINEL